MNSKLDLPVGTSAEVFGKNVVCERLESKACVGCVFDPPEHNDKCAQIACTDDERTDGQFIVLKPAE